MRVKVSNIDREFEKRASLARNRNRNRNRRASEEKRKRFSVYRLAGGKKRAGYAPLWFSLRSSMNSRSS